MADFFVEHIDVEVTLTTIEDDFYKILNEIRPFWQKHHVVYEYMEKEFNQEIFKGMIKCYNKIDPRDAIIIRLTNHQMNFILDRETEIAAITCFMKLDCAPKVQATFQNGFCYNYVEGEILDSSKLGEDSIWRCIADCFAKFHAAKVDDAEQKKETQIDRFINESWKRFPSEFKDPEKNEIFQKHFSSRSELEAELTWIKEYCKNLNSPIVLCHNNTRGENIIWSGKKVTFVDFECAGYNYQALDIASHFARYCGFDPPDFKLYPVKEFQLRWLRYYLEKYNELIRMKVKIDKADVYSLYAQVSKCYLLYLLAQAVTSVTLASLDLVEDEVFNFLEYAVANIKEYISLKDRIIKLKLPE